MSAREIALNLTWIFTKRLRRSDRRTDLDMITGFRKHFRRIVSTAAGIWSRTSVGARDVSQAIVAQRI
jgi:hypothetical protein